MNAFASGTSRSVVDNEVASIFSTPSGITWSQVGAYVGALGSHNFASLSDDAIKVVHARFDKFRPTDETAWAWFPYSALRAYEGTEISAGRPGIFITSQYQGKPRPVVWNWSLGLNGSMSGTPTTPSSGWEYAVNVRDERFIRFWINRYARGVLLQQYIGLHNLWVGLDECAFNQNLYGVIDDSGNFVGGVQWAQPFPQNATEYYQAITYFFNRVKQIAPDLNLMPNVGSLGDWTQFQATVGSAQGMMAEEINPIANVSAYGRNLQYSRLSAFADEASRGCPMILESTVSIASQSAMDSSFVAYQLLKGPNTFYAPRAAGTTTMVNPSTYSLLANALGNPTSPLQSAQIGAQVGNRLYSRSFDGGVVYLNWTGVTQSVALPVGQQWFDKSGNQITTLNIPDLNAGYALSYKSGTNRCSLPRISPRYAGTISGPIYVSISNPDSSGGTIRYTINTAIPYATSPIFRGPFEIKEDSLVQARTMLPAAWTSWDNTALYSVQAGTPQISFVQSSDSIAQESLATNGIYYVLLQLNSIPTATVTVLCTQGQTTVTIQFAAGEQYKLLPVTATGSADMSLSSPTGGTLGVISRFTLTVEMVQ